MTLSDLPIQIRRNSTKVEGTVPTPNSHPHLFPVRARGNRPDNPAEHAMTTADAVSGFLAQSSGRAPTEAQAAAMRAVDTPETRAEIMKGWTPAAREAFAGPPNNQISDEALDACLAGWRGARRDRR